MYGGSIFNTVSIIGLAKMLGLSGMLNVGILLKMLIIKGMPKILLIRIVENDLCPFGGHSFYTFSQLDLLYL